MEILNNFINEIESQHFLKPKNVEQYGDFRVEWSYPEEKPLAWLRALRNKKLKESDWRASADIPEMSQEWKDYRQALRDLPSKYPTPTLIGGDLVDVVWPIEPSK